MRLAVGLLLLASCGRIGFDPGDVATDDGSDANAAGVDASQADLLLWFRFEPGDNFLRDEISGTFASCKSCPTEVSGRVGGAAQFDGTQCLQFPDNPAFRFSAFTLEAWLRPLTLGTGTIISRPLNGESAQTNSWSIQQLDPNGVGFSILGSEGSISSGSNTAVQNTWMHVSSTYDSTSQILYLDGQQSNTNSNQIGDIVYSAADLWFGCDRENDSLTKFLDGTLDEIKIYGRALSAAEVAADATP